jgi:hypothetical protein
MIFIRKIIIPKIGIFMGDNSAEYLKKIGRIKNL